MVETLQVQPKRPEAVIKPSLTATREDEGKLNLERLKYLYETKIRPVADALQEAEGLTKELRLDHERRMAEFALSLRMGKLDEDALGAFWKKPYPRLDPARDPKGRLIPDTFRLSIPRFIPLSVGFLESQDEAWNYFRVNRYMDWFGEIPDFIKKQIGMKEHPEFEGLKIEGGSLVGPTEVVKKAWEDRQFRRFFHKLDGNRIEINKNRAYDLTVSLLREGVKPFSQNPIDPADIITPPPLPDDKEAYQLRPYQKAIWETLCKFSSIGVFIPPGTGKTVIGVYAATHLRPPHLIVVPTNTLLEQWEERIEHHSGLKLNQEIWVATYQTAIKKMSNRDWTLVIFDEVHHIGAKYFIKLSWLKRKYGLGLSATPYREDQGGEELIFALTGEPTGLAWQYFRELHVIKSPICHVWLDCNFDAKLRRLADLLKDQKKTIIFSDSIELGKSVAARYKIPHVFGQSVERLKTLERSQTAVVSRVGDEGVSLPDIERVIEISWLFGCIPANEMVLTPRPVPINQLRSTVCGFDGKRIIQCEGEPFETRFDKVLAINTCVGILRCTADHRILTSTGYVEAEKANDVALALRLPYEDDRVARVARLTGHLFGDGYLATDRRWKTAYRKGHSGWVKFIAEPEDLVEIKKDLASLELPFNERIYGGALRGGIVTDSKGKPHRIQGRTFMMNGNSQTYRFFLNQGVPSGKKSDKDYQVPKWIMNAPKNVQREFLAALFGSDANSIYVRSRRANRLRYAFVKRDNLVSTGIAFANQIRTLLEGFGITTTAPRTRPCTTRKDGSKSIQIEFHINVRDLVKFIDTIGFRYARKKELSARAFWVYMQEKNGIMSQRLRSYQEAMALRRKGIRLKEILAQLGSAGEIPGTVKDWIYREGSPTQSPRWFPTFEQWRDVHVREDFAFVRIRNRSIEGPLQCFDIETRTGNFLLYPGFVVHNSRRQELQRFTRLLHGQKVEGEGHVLMTVDEYLRDRKRLFSILDRGFKIVLHREGVGERVLQSRETTPRRTTRISVEAPTEAEKSASVAGSVQGSAMFASLPPGMQKLILSRKEPEQRLIVHLYSRDGEWQPTNRLYLALNYTSRANMTSIDFGDLEKRRIIERKRGYVRTNFRGFKE